MIKRSFYAIILSCCLPGVVAWGQVANSDAWKIVGIDESAEKLATECRDGLNTLAESIDKLRDAKPLEVGKANAMCNRIIWHSKTLLQYGEPSAVDYYVRAKALSDKIIQITQIRAGKFQKEARAYMSQTARKRKSSISRLQKLVGSKDYIAAEKEYFKVQGDIDLYVHYLRGRDRQVLVEPMLPVYRLLPAGLKKLRTTATKQKLAAMIKEQNFDTASLVNQAKAVLERLNERTGDVSTPESVAELITKWRVIHAKIQRATALDCISKSVDLDLENLSNWKQVATFDGQDTARTLKNTLSPVLVSIIETDLTLARPAALRKKYIGYLKLVSDLKNDLDEATRMNLKGALDAVEKNSSKLAQEIADYREATHDILYWREKLAKDSRHPGAPVAPNLRQAIGGSSSTFQFDTEKLFPGLQTGIDDILPGLRKSAIDRTAKIYSLSVQGITSPHSHFDQQCWAVARNPAGLKSQISSLRRDLMADDKFPMTYQAAESLRTAEQSQWDEVGGSISQLRLASLATRVSNLKDGKSSIYIPLGATFKPFLINSTLIQTEIQPTWVRHRHFLYSSNK